MNQPVSMTTTAGSRHNDKEPFQPNDNVDNSEATSPQSRNGSSQPGHDVEVPPVVENSEVRRSKNLAPSVVPSNQISLILEHKEVMQILQNNQQSLSSLPEYKHFEQCFQDVLKIAEILAKINERRLRRENRRHLCERPRELSSEDRERLQEIEKAGLSVADKLIDLVPVNKLLDIFLSKPGEEDEPGGYNEGLLKKLRRMDVFFDRISMKASNTADPYQEMFFQVLTARIVVSILTIDSVCKKWPLAEFMCGLARLQRYRRDNRRSQTDLQQKPIPLIVDAMPGTAWLKGYNMRGERVMAEAWFDHLSLLLPLGMLWPAVITMKHLSEQDHQQKVAENVKEALSAGRGHRNYPLSWPTRPTFWSFRRLPGNHNSLIPEHEKVMQILQNNQQSLTSLPQHKHFEKGFQDVLKIVEILAEINERRLNRDSRRHLCERPRDLSPKDKQRLQEIVKAGLLVADKLIDLVPVTSKPSDIFLSKPGDEDEPGGYNEGLLEKLENLRRMDVFFDRITMEASNTADPHREMFRHVLSARIVVSILTIDSVCKKWPLAEFMCGLARLQRYRSVNEKLHTVLDGRAIQQKPIPLIVDAMPGTAWLKGYNTRGDKIQAKAWFEHLKLLLPLGVPWPIVIKMKNSDKKREHQQEVVKNVKEALGGEKNTVEPLAQNCAYLQSSCENQPMPMTPTTAYSVAW